MDYISPKIDLEKAPSPSNIPYSDSDFLALIMPAKVLLPIPGIREGRRGQFRSVHPPLTAFLQPSSSFSFPGNQGPPPTPLRTHS